MVEFEIVQPKKGSVKEFLPEKKSGKPDKKTSKEKAVKKKGKGGKEQMKLFS